MTKKTQILNPTTLETKNLKVGLCDLNGIFRGKRTAIDELDKVLKNGIRMPLSAVGADVWGADVFGNLQVFETGDTDGVCTVTERGPLTSVINPRSVFVPVTMFEESGKPYLADPRQALVHVLERFKKAKLTPVAAMELEFYLIKDERHQSNVPLLFGQAITKTALLSIDALDELEVIFDEIYAEANSWNIELEATISEAGLGQFEINLSHLNDIVRLCDNVSLLKRIIRQVAKKHGLIASFMAKPFGGESGNGLHTHISLLNAQGINVFDDGTEKGSDTLLYAIAGLLDSMPDSTLIFAPHGNSYNRLRPFSHAPTAVLWGYDNRTTSIRVPGGEFTARRIEHRVAGADSNPYLVIASILAGIDAGINNKKHPQKPTQGNAYEAKSTQIPTNWGQSVDMFGQSTFIKNYFDESLIRLFTACKKQEIDTFAKYIGSFDYATYLKSV